MWLTVIFMVFVCKPAYTGRDFSPVPCKNNISIVARVRVRDGIFLQLILMEREKWGIQNIIFAFFAGLGLGLG